MKNRKASFEATLIKPLPPQDSGISLNIVRVPSNWIDSKKADPSKLVRRQPVTVINNENGVKAVCYAMGAGQMRLPQGAIGLDYDNRDRLGIGWKATEVSLTVRPATLLELHGYALSHPDAMVRIANRLGYLGVVLGIEPIFQLFDWILSMI